jgi:two-component system, LytTR family, sensor kinase
MLLNLSERRLYNLRMYIDVLSNFIHQIQLPMHRLLNSILLRNISLLLFFEGLIWLTLAADNKRSAEAFLSVSLAAVGIYLLLFIFNHFIIRLLLFRHRFTLFALSGLLYWALATVIVLLIFDGFKTEQIPSAILNAIVLMLLGSGIYFIFIWIRENLLQTGEKLRQKEAELQLLHQQLNPHFLMNALNNLYGVSLSEPEMVSAKILELSELLRYQIKASRAERVSLESEMQFIEKYISHQSWKSSNLKANFEAEADAPDLQIPPLLFLPLIENSLKFSLETPAPAFEAKLICKGNMLLFSISNNCLTAENRKKSTNLGLQNLKQRLALSGIRHTLTTAESDPEQYKVTLQLWM